MINVKIDSLCWYKRTHDLGTTTDEEHLLVCIAFATTPSQSQ